ncbi:tryptophan synthase subunit alpha [Cohnella caldifontis]|uniref:tryptophan synthase subunit alpha n=1 Tax=Cohnella caldifontis TaxID=3027471 RepID=UPI0023ED04BE|nr:tryptophan synthase subunit alpha [Cohnella sp. YIM B05605]
MTLKILHNPFNAETYRAAQERGEALLIGYLVAGDPTAEESLEMIQASVQAGIDIIELGVPSPDPYVDGEVIKRAHKRALDAGAAASEGLLPLWRRIRRGVSSPIWAMGYKRELVEEALYRSLAEEKLIDALVLPDCSLEEQIRLQNELGPAGIDVVRFINSSMDEEAIRRTCDGATIIYAQSYSGTTGDPLARVQGLGKLCDRIRPHLPGGLIVAGFGLRTPDRVGSAVDSGFDGAVVGSVLVRCCENREKDYLYRLVAEMKLETARSDKELNR